MRNKYFITLGANKGFIIERFFDQVKDADEWSVHAFECLPECVTILNNKFENKITLHAVAASTEDSIFKFVVGTSTKSGTLRKDKKINVTSNSLLVESVDFSSWLSETVSEDDHVVLTMDIEGAEYDVVPKLLESGNINLVDKFYLEFHGARCLDNFDPVIEKSIIDGLGSTKVDVVFAQSGHWGFHNI